MACIPKLLGVDEDVVDELLLELGSVCERVDEDPRPLEYETYDVGGDSPEVVEDPSPLEGDNEDIKDVVFPDDEVAFNGKGGVDGEASAKCGFACTWKRPGSAELLIHQSWVTS